MVGFRFDLLHQGFELRPMCAGDAQKLGHFFDQLSDETRRRYAPHPLNSDFACQLCQQIPSAAQIERWLLLRQAGSDVVGYFIFDKQMSPHEQGRYREQGIELRSGLDWLFAPVIADAWQGKGLASAVMPLLVQHARDAGARSLVLLGGTQSTNHRGIAFYRKAGFEQHGGYQTEIYNLDMRLPL